MRFVLAVDRIFLVSVDCRFEYLCCRRIYVVGMCETLRLVVAASQHVLLEENRVWLFLIANNLSHLSSFMYDRGFTHSFTLLSCSLNDAAVS